MKIAAIVIDVVWLVAVIPAIITQAVAMRQAYADRRNVGTQLGISVSILISGSIRRERIRFVFHCLMLLIGIIALFSRSDEGVHHMTRLITMNAIVTVAIITGQYLQVYNSVMDLRDRHLALSRSVRPLLPRGIGWLWKWLVM